MRDDAVLRHALPLDRGLGPFPYDLAYKITNKITNTGNKKNKLLTSYRQPR